jgi:OHCU decarboxylase
MDQPKHDLRWLNRIGPSEATTEFLKCCGSLNWATQMVKSRPFANLDQLSTSAVEIWWGLEQVDWLEAFRSHPKIGGKKTANEVSSQSRSWSEQEQRGIQSSATETLEELGSLNEEYELKFGYIYIVCASGKSSEEMLAILKTRMQNDAKTEIRVAAGEQQKITEIRLRKLIG